MSRPTHAMTSRRQLDDLLDDRNELTGSFDRA
jgi:hypothetical protein